MSARFADYGVRTPDDGRAFLARHDLLLFTRRMFPEYQVGAHHRQIALALHAVEAGEIDRLAITMPPRHGKSTLASEHFPAWFLGRNPDQRIIATSYAASLAYSFSRRARNLFSHPQWPFSVATAGDLSNVQRWDIADHRGGYYAAGVGGGVTGQGADLLVVDDPIRSAEDADSQVIRDRAWEWFTQDALTRLEPGGRVVLVGTRWHADDPIGRALAQGGWTHLNMPAISDDGEALWPERFSLADLEQRRAEIGTRAFNALYQQRPSPAEGAILKREWWGYWEATPPRFDWLLQAWDTAYKTGQENDWSVGFTFGLADGAIYVLDRWRDRVEFPALERAVREQDRKWQPDELVVEDAASGQSLIQQLARPLALLPGQRSVLPVVPWRPDRDKVARANAISPYLEAGRVLLPARAAWRDEFIEEAAAFPTGAHDDQVDALSMGVLRLLQLAQTDRPLDDALVLAFAGMPR